MPLGKMGIESLDTVLMTYDDNISVSSEIF